MQFTTDLSNDQATALAQANLDTLRPVVESFFRTRYGYSPTEDLSGSTSAFLADPFGYAGRPGSTGFWADFAPILAALDTPTPTPVLTPEGDQTARDAQAKALATMRRRESMALADRAAADQRIRDLEHRLSIALATPAPSGSVAWGPSHPDWHSFWLQAARDAERAGNCGEYDRHAEEMGAPTRADFRRAGEDLDGRRFLHVVDVEVSFQVTVSSSDEDGPDDDEIADAAREYIANNGADTVVSDFSSSVYSTERDYDADAEPIWVNPGRA